MINKTFPASLDKLYEMLLFIKGYSEELGMSQRAVTNIELAAEEALVNIISYGYPKEAGSIEIDCSIVDDNGVKIIIKDNGIAYNPLINKSEINRNIPTEERRIGGYGIFFILKIMDQVDYQREDESNILTLIKFSEK